MEFYEQKTTTFQNQNGRVRSAFKVVKAKDGVMKSMEGVTNRNDNTLYHILQTIRKNNMEMRSRYSIHVDDLKRLLIEGDRMNDYRKMENTPVLRKKAVAKVTMAVPKKPSVKSAKATKTTKSTKVEKTKKLSSKKRKKTTKSKKGMKK